METVTALEPSPEMIEVIKETIEQEGTRNVQIIQGSWPETDDSFEEAMAETRRRFKLASPSEHDAFLDDLLKRRLTCRDGRYVWPSEVRSALIYWNGSANSTTSVTAGAGCTMRTRA